MLTFARGDLRQLGDIGLVVEELRMRADIDPACIMLVGARCRDAIHSALGHTTANTVTRDVDLGVALNDWSAYERVNTVFRRRGSNGICFAIAGLPVDVMPFGSRIEDPSGIASPLARPDGLVVFGFEQVFADAVVVELPGTGAHIKIPTPAGYVALKTRAWVDRSPYGEDKDARDLALALTWYHQSDVVMDRLYGRQIAIAERYEFDMQYAAAHLLGADVRSVLADEKADDLARAFAASDLLRFSSYLTAEPVEHERRRTITGAFEAGLAGSP